MLDGCAAAISPTTRSTSWGTGCSATTSTTATISRPIFLAHLADEETQRWWQLTDPCQQPVPEAGSGDWWTPMEQVFLME